MLPSKSDQQIARIHIILTAVSVGVTTLYLLSVILGMAVFNSGRYGGTSGFFDGRIVSPWEISAYLAASGFGSWIDELLPFWWKIASLAGTIGYGLNIGILTTSIMGIRVQKYPEVSWTGYLMGIIGAGVGITIIFNTMTWWLAGYILMILSLIMTMKTQKQITASLETYGEGQPQQMPQQPSMTANPFMDQTQQPFYQNQASQQQFNTMQQQPMGAAPQTQTMGIAPDSPQPMDASIEPQPVQPTGTTTAFGQPVSFTPQQSAAPQVQQTVTPKAPQAMSEVAETEQASRQQASLESSEADAAPVNPQALNTVDEKINESEGQEQSASTQPEETKE